MIRLIPLLTLVLLSLAAASRAELLVAESFDYDVGDLDGQDGGLGFGDSWTVFSDFTFEVVEPSEPLAFDMPGSGLISGGNRALRFGNDEFDDGFVLDNEVEALRRAFNSPTSDESVYFSFLYRYGVDGFIDNNDFVVWWFNDASGPQTGLKGNGGDGSIPDDWVGRVNNQFAPPQQAYVEGIDIVEEDGETYFTVIKMTKADFSDEPDDYDVMEIWVNPTFSESDSPHAVAEATFDNFLFGELDSIGMRAFNQEPGDEMFWDELRIGTTWEDVVAPIGGAVGTPGDFNGNGALDQADVNALIDQITGDGDLAFDLNGDSTVNSDDLNTWVKDLKKSWFGDANLDNEFNSGDLVIVFQGGLFEQDADATWGQGDWNGDHRFDSADIVAAFQDGGFELGPPPATNAVPEPSSMTILFSAALMLLAACRGTTLRLRTT